MKEKHTKTSFVSLVLACLIFVNACHASQNPTHEGTSPRESNEFIIHDQKEFGHIRFLGYKNKDHLRTLCTCQKTLKQHAPYQPSSCFNKKGQDESNESLLLCQKKLAKKLCSFEQKTRKTVNGKANIKQLLKFVAIMEMLWQDCDSTNFTSPQCNIKKLYASIITSTRNHIESYFQKKIPVNLPVDFIKQTYSCSSKQKLQELKLTAFCETLGQKMDTHRALMTTQQNYNEFALEAINSSCHKK